jgi:hypothetical protein
MRDFLSGIPRIPQRIHEAVYCLFVICGNSRLVQFACEFVRKVGGPNWAIQGCGVSAEFAGHFAGNMRIGGCNSVRSESNSRGLFLICGDFPRVEMPRNWGYSLFPAFSSDSA